MKCCGIVTEFNPFHNGHALLCKMARERGCTHIVAVMSGNFVQRGELAVTDKHVRTRAALLGGVDLVVELPLPYAMSTAQTFSFGAVNILKSCGCVDTLFFGSECGDIALLRRTADAVDDERLTELMREHLKRGITYAKARELAVTEIFGEDVSGVLSESNNILGVEYIRQGQNIGWDVEYATIKRVGVRHDSPVPKRSDGIASASYLRSVSVARLSRYVPREALEVYRGAAEAGMYPADVRRMECAILSHLRRLGRDRLSMLPDISEGLENRLYKSIRSATSLEELTLSLKTKRYTLSRVRRLILGAFLGIRNTDASQAPPYIRVLGANARGREILSKMKGCGIPVHTSLAALERLGGEAGRLASLEAEVGDICTLALPKPRPCGYEYTASAVFL